MHGEIVQGDDVGRQPALDVVELRRQRGLSLDAARKLLHLSAERVEPADELGIGRLRPERHTHRLQLLRHRLDPRISSIPRPRHDLLTRGGQRLGELSRRHHLRRQPTLDVIELRRQRLVRLARTGHLLDACGELLDTLG